MIMTPAGVITKLYFVIFVAFKESMTLNLAHRSFQGQTFWPPSKARVQVYTG